MTDGRRLAAIPTVDVVGHSRVMGGDGAGGAGASRGGAPDMRGRLLPPEAGEGARFADAPLLTPRAPRLTPRRA